MAPTVLMSKRVVEVSVFIVRECVELRETLARSSLDPDTEQGVEAAWLQEIGRRARELDTGAARAIPWEIARERLMRAPRD